MNTKVTMEQQLAEIWQEEKKRFNHPDVKDPVISDDPTVDTALFDFSDRSIHLFRAFVEKASQHMPKRAENPKKRTQKALTRHEVGHYIGFPKDISYLLYFRAKANEYFGEKAEAIYPLFADFCNEIALHTEGQCDEEIIDLRIACAALDKTERKFDINKVMAGLYSDLFGLEGPELNDYEKELVEKLAGILEGDKRKGGINFYPGDIRDPLNARLYEAALYQFGKLMEDKIPKQPSGKGGFGGIGDDTDIDRIPNSDIDRALSDILGKMGKRAYESVKKYLKKKRPSFKDPFDEHKPKTAGLGRTDFHLNDDLIPLYSRWASGYGLYIAKRPVEKDSTALYRQGLKDYEPGDNLADTAIFQSKGQIGIPGVSQIWLKQEGDISAVKWSVPHLNVGIDSSGSMTDPSSRTGAMQVLAAYILGYSYHSNGSMVGGWNFSSDIAFMQPTRELNDFYSLMAGYWGGGTVINTEKVKTYLEQLGLKTEGITFTDEKDYEYQLDKMHVDKRLFEEKDLHVDTSKLKTNVEKLDNVLITDGYIGNSEEVLQHLSTMAKYTRNFIFITNKQAYQDWSKINVPNTYVYLAEKPEDLVGLALGVSKSLAQDAGSNYSSFSSTTSSKSAR